MNLNKNIIRYSKCWNWNVCFPEDPIQKIVEQMDPPGVVDEETESKYTLKPEHDQWLLNFSLCPTAFCFWFFFFDCFPAPHSSGCCCQSLKTKVRAGFTSFVKRLWTCVLFYFDRTFVLVWRPESYGPYFLFVFFADWSLGTVASAAALSNQTDSGTEIRFTKWMTS